MTPVFQADRNESNRAKRILTALSCAAIVMVVYGSWLPFDFQTPSIESWGSVAWDRISWAPTNLSDVITNIVIFVPIGLLISMRLQRSGRHRVLALILPIAAAALISFASEAGQTLIPQRTASFTDMLLHGVGTLVGISLAAPCLHLGGRLITQLKLALALHPQRALFWIIVTLVILAKLAPFDFTITPTGLAGSLATARWSPFGAPRAVPQSIPEELVEMAGSFFAFALLGILGTRSLREDGERPSVCAVNTIAKLILLAVAIELVQIVIASHTCDAVDALTHVYGAVVGTVLGLTLIAKRRAADLAPANLAIEHVLLTAALVVQFVLIVAYAFPADAQWALPSADSIQWVPFHAQFKSPFAVAAGRIVSSFMWYASFAAIAAVVLARRVQQHRLVPACLVTVGVVTLAEAAQAFSATRTADVTEPLLAVIASLAATAACRWVQQCRRIEPQTVFHESF